MKFPESVSISNSTPSFLAAAISDPIEEPTMAPKTVAISSSGSESVISLPILPPIIAPATAPASLLPSIRTVLTLLIIPKITYCCFCASDLDTTSG